LETVQRQLSEYLQCELYHLLGAYGLAEKQLRHLGESLSAETQTDPSSFEASDGRAETGAVVLEKLVRLSGQFNHTLSWYRYASDPLSRANPRINHSADEESWPVREPLPGGLPMTDIERFVVGPRDGSLVSNRDSPWSSDRAWDRIPRFYSEAIAALKAHEEILGGKSDRYDEGDADRLRQINFARGLLASRDGATEWRKPRAARDHLRRRVDRYEERLRKSVKQIGSKLPDKDVDATFKRFLGRKQRDRGRRDFLKLIIENQPADGEESLSVFVLRVQAEAHLSMHAVEAWRSMCIGEQAEAIKAKEDEWLERELERSIALSTFSYCVSRTAPWIFARSEEERRSVIRDVSAAWENVVPVRCMWIASQIGLLSLHRRAYARALQGKPEDAYNDYHKLQRLIRDTERRVGESPLHISGARGFLAGLNAEAHHHVGELYRSEHAHKPALEHFEAASHRLEQLRKGDKKFDKVLTNSRWYVELQISRGKACYEMGRHKEALYWHLRAWRAFLELLSSETETETNTEYIVAAIDWLESVKFEPELRKSEISDWIGPVVDQLDRITAVGRVGALAAEILLRLGHLLFVLNVGYFDPRTIEEPTESPQRELAARERIRKTLAFPCFVKAAECDPYSTLIGADLMKTRFRFNTWWDGALPEAYSEGLESRPLKKIDQHWPRGGGDYERLARMAEYLMLKARKRHFEAETNGADVATTDGLLARDLLLDLFMSTDSINVRKSQIHRFLMAAKKPGELPCDERTPAIELICMRRYSSPFPLLPRPSAFRALGGGYFIRLHSAEPAGEDDREKHPDSRPYGIVVDPGVDFVENLYRAGYSLGDIDMVAITHDHVDHLGALDPLLSLLHVRSQILEKQDPDKDDAEVGDERKKVLVLTSKSVDDRYAEVTKLSGEESRNFNFRCFERSPAAKVVVRLKDDPWFPQDFEILAMSSAAGASDKARRHREEGHPDLSDKPSHGLCFRHASEKSPSIAINSDTPPPPPRISGRRRKEWERAWAPALAADVLVVHLGSVPLTELRQMDGLEHSADGGDPEWGELAENERELIGLQGKLQLADEKLEGQIEYAQWLRSHEPKGEERKEVTAPIVGPVPTGWLPPPEHNYLAGLLRWARAYEQRRWGAQHKAERAGKSRRKTGPQGLFVVGELSEELGTMRGKVATRLNRRIFKIHESRPNPDDLTDLGGATGFPYALTADIGLHACVYPGKGGDTRVEVLCTNCNLDADRTPRESYHPAHDVYEVCVKGENEGIFYNCLEHDPARQEEPTFLEQLERFDIFGR
jgi:tetratricopeptide (TPR) repeat protein